MRAAVVGGTAYYAGKKVQQSRTQNADQNAQIDDLQQQQQQQQAPPAPAAAAPEGMADQLAKLKSLLDSGALTQSEYEAAKQKVIQDG
jgi:membrane protease subunit (stomatin/prohibitin family)